MMGTCYYSLPCKSFYPNNAVTIESTKVYHIHARGNTCQKSIYFGFNKHHIDSVIVGVNMEETVQEEVKENNNRRFRWIEVSRNMTEAQRHAVSKLPFRMANRCKALMRQIICFSDDKGNVSDLLEAWVKIMKPIRADWLSVLKELKTMGHPFYIKVAEHALLEESFETDVRDYTKIIHYYGDHNQLEDAENLLTAMKQRGFICDQVILTAMINIYSKAGHLNQAEEYFEEIKLLGETLDKRSYGSMIMAYIRAGVPEHGENLLQEMDEREIYAGSEVYKALLRAFSKNGNAEGAQRVFDAIQLAGISPDDKICGHVIDAYGISGQSEKAFIAFQNMRGAGIEPTDKCIAFVLAAFEKESKLNKALQFLIDLERDGIMVGVEASGILARWFRKLGVVEEVEHVLRDFAGR